MIAAIAIVVAVVAAFLAGMRVGGDIVAKRLPGYMGVMVASHLPRAEAEEFKRLLDKVALSMERGANG